MKDAVRTLTRDAEGKFWFVVTWDQSAGIGYATGEAECDYDAELKVINLPKVTAPVPGGNISFEPEVGGKLTDTNTRRTFPIVGVLKPPTDSSPGQLLLSKFLPPDDRTEQQKLDDEAAGRSHPSQDAPLEFTLQADPGVSGGLSGAAGSVSVGSEGVNVSAGGVSQDLPGTGVNAGVIVQKIPMTPFSPFNDEPGAVEKRPGGPYAASYETKRENLTAKWIAVQGGGEQRTPPGLTPEMRREIDRLRQLLR
jgi:hypothetical protein